MQGDYRAGLDEKGAVMEALPPRCRIVQVRRQWQGRWELTPLSAPHLVFKRADEEVIDEPVWMRRTQ